MNPDIFTGRDREIALIDDALERIRSSEKTNVCFLGVPGSGKTSLLKKYIALHRSRWQEEGVILVYISLQDLGPSPYDLAAGFVGEVLARVAFTFRTDIDLSALRRPETFSDAAASLRSRALKGFLSTLDELPAGADGEQQGLVQNAFRFPNAFAEEKRIRLILFVDDFGDLRKYTNPAMAAFEEFHAAISDQTEAFYVTAMTNSPFADRIFTDAQAPLNQSFSVSTLRGIETAEARDAAVAFMGAGSDESALRAASLLASLSAGNPLLLRHMSSAAAKSAGSGASPTESDVAQAFAEEVVSPLGRIYRHYLGNIQKAVGLRSDYSTARKILAMLAEGKDVSPDEIRKKTGIDVETSARIVGRVLGSGLFRKVDEAFYFDDPLFRFWALKTDPSEDQGQAVRDKAQSRALADEFLDGFLGRKKEEAKAAPAKSKKFNFRDLIAACKGRSVGGGPLGAGAEVRFPEFDVIKGFAFSTKQVKMYYLEGGGEHWAMLVVWWPLKADRKQVELFADKAAGKLSRLWFVCRGGFTEDGASAAKERSVYISDEKDLVKLLESIE